MAKYVSLVNWTDQGVRDFKDTVDRAEAVEQLANSMGGSMELLLWTLGTYDLVAVSEFPDDETATAFALAVSSQGNVRTSTMRAFNKEQMRDILAKAG